MTTKAFQEPIMRLMTSLSKRKYAAKIDALPARMAAMRAWDEECWADFAAKWHAEFGEDTAYKAQLDAKDPTVLASSACCKELLLADFWACEEMSKISRKYLWLYLSQVSKAAAALDGIDDIEPPLPSGGASEGAGNNSSPFGNPSNLAGLARIAQSLPPSVLQKVTALASSYKEGIEGGEVSADDVNLADLTSKLASSITRSEVTEMVSGVRDLLNDTGGASAMPEMQSLLRSMQANMQEYEKNKKKKKKATAAPKESKEDVGATPESKQED